MLDKFVESFTTTFCGWAVWTLILGVSVVFAGICLWLISSDTKKYKGFRESLSKGTKVFASTAQTGFNGVVTNIDDEFVTIETKIRRHRVYPESNKK
jgi:preprotein translocase subunit YajC